MQNVLADLAVESEAATISPCGWRAPTTNRSPDDEQAEAFERIATAVAKYWICKRAPAHVVRGLECLGGNGYVEESMMPGYIANRPQLDLGRIGQRPFVWTCCEPWRRAPTRSTPSSPSSPRPRAIPGWTPTSRSFVPTSLIQVSSRGEPARLVERMALALQASLLIRFGDEAVADAFCASRLGGDWGRAFGTLPAGARLPRDHRASPRSLSLPDHLAGTSGGPGPP